ncbi:MAG: L,D-transpeptidase family protein [Kiritimatiellae bacterium]|jgi:murein L,D-transpeptidase YafK|nr:L,D-transpeptidase family protein [Kiritimatiellia bacterium]
MKIKSVYIFLVAITVVGLVLLKCHKDIYAKVQNLRGNKTVAERIEQFGSIVHERITPDFERIGVDYPPQNIVLVGIKQDKKLEVWVSQPPVFLKSYSILGASGKLGHKLKEGDKQVPEGFYKVESLNPNSMFHLALRLNYPNSFDIEKAQIEYRNNLGSDIMIHGSNCSIGCLAMGNEAIEELFVMSAETGIDNISVILTPIDFRKQELPDDFIYAPIWVSNLYISIKTELLQLQH